ncbi:tRNA pseudouridine(38-40) synthase [Kwoniella dendrophila CBS 6074]|uniref:tRNA pseudouridine(38-40) synthase n=1 Tax=Kwoniella dendrophila CBS 6074 TaxID=1295534 RepID=A0AAX4JWS8_9TREE
MSYLASLSREELIARIESLEAAVKVGEKNGSLTTEVGSSTSIPVTSSSSSSSRPALPETPSSPSPLVDENGKPLRKHDRKVIRKKEKEFRFNSHGQRHIALIISYHGWPYCGIALQDKPEIKTVESELLNALIKTKLIEDTNGINTLEGCGYSRCGRTDRGVSGNGQIVNLWVRSLRKRNDGGESLPNEFGYKDPTEDPIPSKPTSTSTEIEEDEIDGNSKQNKNKNKIKNKEIPSSPILEFPYPKLLNSVLPPSIRILGWSPLNTEFDSRFSCKFRHYKYAFHLKPTPSSDSLNLKLMEKGCEYLIGENDHRNFCKLDGSKQIKNHKRTILKAYFQEDDKSKKDGIDISQETSGSSEEDENYDDIEKEQSKESKKIIFNLIGTAFLWHQVRHIISVLFLIGMELEKPEIIKDLLNVEKYPSKPLYTMGDPLPLTLFECGYEQGLLDWRFSGYDGPWQSLSIEKKLELWDYAMNGKDSFERQLLQSTQKYDLKSWQINNSLNKLRQIFPTSQENQILSQRPETNESNQQKQIIYPVGGGEFIIGRSYKELKDRPRGETPDQVNEKYRLTKGDKKKKSKMEVEATNEDE